MTTVVATIDSAGIEVTPKLSGFGGSATRVLDSSISEVHGLGDRIFSSGIRTPRGLKIFFYTALVFIGVAVLAYLTGMLHPVACLMLFCGGLVLGISAGLDIYDWHRRD